jgi:guanosine-3',5'-bis(diphosphate) 3'-pyrophosphohydrolase
MTDSELLIRAADFAARKHQGQKRKGLEEIPYMNHLTGVARVLSVEGRIGDVTTLCAALLHDTIEDTETSAPELEAEFGAAIASIVVEVTDDKRIAKADRKRLQIEHAAHISPRAQLVKLADKICNVRDVAGSPPPSWPLQRRQEYFDWAKQVIDQLRGVHPGLEAVFDMAYAARPA